MSFDLGNVDELRFVLPPDIVIVPVRSLAPGVRSQIEWTNDDFAVSRPRMRRPSKVVDRASAGLLEEFREPSTIVEAVLRYSRARVLDACRTLEEAFPALESLVAGEVLVPAGSETAQAVAAPLVAGMCLGAFEIVRLVQALEDSALYEAVNRGGERVALKVLPPTAPEPSRRMLAWEAAVLAHLDGHHTPRLLANQIEDGRHFLALEWISGVNAGTAAARLRGSAADRRHLHSLCARLLAAFGRLHDDGVVHGDIHPGNILVRPDGTVVILDFGRSRFTGIEIELAAAPRAGLGYYYEPELACAILRGELPPEPTEAGEQYALAALVYFLLTGSHYQDLSLERDNLLQQVASQPPLPFARRGIEPWPAVEATLARALEKDPRRRYASVAEFAREFAGAAAQTRRREMASDYAGPFLRELQFGTQLFTEGVKTAPLSSVAFGSAGLALVLYRTALVRDDPRLLALADAWAERTGTASEGAFHAPALGLTAAALGTSSILHGPAGVEWLRALIADARQDRRARDLAMRAFLDRVTPEHSGDVMFGSAGAVLAASELLDVCGPSTELAAWMARAAAGIDRQADVPGIAHGAAGCLYATLRAHLSAGVPVCPAALEQLEQLAAQQPLTAPGWCRGTGGMVHLWALAHTIVGDRRFAALGNRDAEYTFRHPDGNPDLCCGLAGRAFALLRWYRHTGEPVWLRRARILQRKAQQAAVFLENPYGLLKGAAGVALLAVELELPVTARMPL